MIVLLGGFLLLMVFGVPVAVAMAVASLAYLLVHGGAPDVIVAQRMIAGVESFPLLAVPFFILAGNLMNIAGVTGRIYAFAVALVGWMRGGLAQVNIIGSVIFSGMSGTAVADAAGIGTIEIKAMKDHGYPLDVAVGVTAASATLGPIIPPSLPFVIYGMMANVSIGALFLGGVLPGVLMTLFMMVTVAILARLKGWGSDAPFQLRQIAAALVEILVVLMYPGRRIRAGIPRLQPERRDLHRARRRPGARLSVQVFRRDGADDAGHPDRRHDARLVHADGSGGRGGDVVAVPRTGALSVDDHARGGEGDVRHHRDDRIGAVHRDGRLDLCLAAHRQPGGGGAVEPDLLDHRRKAGCS